MFIETNQIKLGFNMAYGNCKDLPGRAISNKILHDKSFIIAENMKYENINTSLPQCFIIF